jgi:hypothetical protein
MSLWSTRNMPYSIPSPRRTQLQLRPLEERNLLATGGGFTGGGIVGEYFDNAELAGEPAFVRRDVRVDFDWQDRAPGGSTSPSFERVAADNFSVRWNGQFIPKFAETYTFHLTGDDGARLWVRPAGESFEWNLLIDTWEAPTADAVVADYVMASGSTYDVRVEYRELEGTANARLAWSGPSTPEEAIETAVNLGVNAVTYDYYLYADASKTGRPAWRDPVDYFGGPQVAVDSLGWPTADAGHLFWSGRDPAKTGGTYLLRFTGQAEVNGWMGRGLFRVEGLEPSRTLPLGMGYDPETNTTTAEIFLEGTDIFGLNFVGTKRLPEDLEPTGVTNVQLMRPIAPTGETAYAPGELFDADVKKAFSRFTTLRHLTANFNAEKEWGDRKLPDAMQSAWGDRAALWEHEVMLANETGKDLYITLPVGASADYIRNLALLIRYGSDGVTPYSEPAADPVYPGLNPNLRLYVEWGNEIWNWTFNQFHWAANAGRDAVLNGTPEGQIVNFDGTRPNGDFRRWAALRTVESSNIFREVWTDAAMGEQIRVVFEYQYNNQQSTAAESLKFIDKYFNNGDGTEHVLDPRPVNYFIWGAGGAAYFGAANPRGLINDIWVPGGAFEGILAGVGGTATPTPVSTLWGFSGDAGVYRDLAGIPNNTPMVIPGLGKVPATPNGKQALYISGKGSAWVTITFPRAGIYAIDFQAAGELGPDKGNLLDFYLNDQRITPDGHNLTPAPYPWWPGNGGRDPSKFSTYGTVPVQITTPGKYTFRMVGRGSDDRTTVIDDVRIASMDAIFKSPIPTGVRYAGEVSRIVLQTQLAQQASFAQAYGLKVVAYEGGWSLGGAGEAVPLESWAKYRDPRTASIMAQSVDAFHRASGDVYIVGTFDQWFQDDAAHADLFPLMKGIDASLTVLPAAPSPRLVLRTSLPVWMGTASSLQSLSQPVNVAPGDWASWTVNVTTAGEYRITSKAAPDGWTALSVDGIEFARGSSGLTPGGVVQLSAGVHTIRVQSTGGWYLLRGITIDQLESLSSP